MRDAGDQFKDRSIASLLGGVARPAGCERKALGSETLRFLNDHYGVLQSSDFVYRALIPGCVMADPLAGLLTGQAGAAQLDDGSLQGKLCTARQVP